MTKSTCGAVALANAKTAADPMLVRGNTIGYAQPGPLTGSASLSLSGASAYAAEVKSASATTTFTELIWFKAGANGTMLGFTNTPTITSPTTWDRMLWLDATGHVVFGVKSSSNVELVSPAATYANNAWHLAAGTVSSSGMTLTIDGVAVATTTSVKSASSYTGYWHAGWDNVTSSWTDPPTNAVFHRPAGECGDLPAAVDSADRRALQRRHADHVGEPAHHRRHHELVDSRRQRHDRVHRNHSQRHPERLRFRRRDHRDRGRHAAAARRRRAPQRAPRPTSSLTLSSLASTVTIASLPSPSQALTFTETLARDSTNTVAAFPYATGLHLTTSIAVIISNAAFSATLTWVSQDVVL